MFRGLGGLREKEEGSAQERGNLGLHKACLRVTVSNLAGVVSLQKGTRKINDRKISWRDILGSPVVKTFPVHCRGVQVQNLVGKLRNCGPGRAAKIF